MNTENLTPKIYISQDEEHASLDIRTGKALPMEHPKDVIIKGVLRTPLDWLSKRASEIDHKKAHIIVDREEMTIKLIIDEQNPYTKTHIEGGLSIHPVFERFQINSHKYITPFEMAELFKMNRSFFDNQQTAMELVTLLKNFRSKVNKEVEAEINQNKGDKRMLMDQKVETNLPPSIVLNIPLFKGYAKQSITCETYFNPEDLTCTLISPQANDLTEEIRDKAIDEVITEIKSISNNIAIVEI